MSYPPVPYYQTDLQNMKISFVLISFILYYFTLNTILMDQNTSVFSQGDMEQGYPAVYEKINFCFSFSLQADRLLNQPYAIKERHRHANKETELHGNYPRRKS
jgi:hypothetical protein